MSYIGVHDVDRTVAKAREAGAGLLMPARDIAGVGRFALLSDPQGAPFYIMRGEDAVGESVSYTPGALGHADWNELNTPEPEAAAGFYCELFGWRNDETMQMGELGDYRFIDGDTARLGAISPLPPDFGPPRWRTYFRVGDVPAAAETARKRGAQILVEPYRVPSGELIMIGLDPEGVEFALAGPGD
jgi:predicted enzyme related to lactoylglutathione lyase